MEQKDLKLSGYRQLEQLRQEYESLPVPLEARDRILAGIAQGKKETDKAQMKGVIFMKLMKRTGMTAAAAMVAITLLTNLHPTIANAMEQIPVIGPIAKVVTFRTYENKTNNFEANIQIPQIEAAPETLNKSIEEYAQELIAAYEGELSQSQGEGSYSLDSSYKVVTDNDRYLCLRIDTTIVMASGAQSTKIFTIDKTTGKQLSLKELFKDRPEMLSSITANIKEQMASQMAALGYDNVFVGTVEGEPEETACEAVIEAVKAAGYKNVILRPLMVVAGDHANNDMAGADDDSWKSMFTASGNFDKVDTQIAGLGEIEAVQQIYVDHTKAAIDSLGK